MNTTDTHDIPDEPSHPARITRRTFVKRTGSSAIMTVLALNAFRNECQAAENSGSYTIKLTIASDSEDNPVTFNSGGDQYKVRIHISATPAMVSQINTTKSSWPTVTVTVFAVASIYVGLDYQGRPSWSVLEVTPNHTLSFSVNKSINNKLAVSASGGTQNSVDVLVGGRNTSLTLGTQIQTKMTYQDETSCNVIINALGGISRSVINHVGVHTDGVDLSWADPTVANPNSISLTDNFILVAQ